MAPKGTVCSTCDNMRRLPRLVKFVGNKGRVVCVECKRLVPKGNSPEGERLFWAAWGDNG